MYVSLLLIWSIVGDELPQAEPVLAVPVANSEVCVKSLAHLAVQVGEVNS